MTSNTTQLNTYNTALSANTVMPHIFGFLCLCIPLFSINTPNAFYYSCIALLLVSSGYLVTLRPSLNLKNPERWLLIAFFAYPLWAGSDMLLRDTWNLVDLS